MIKTITVAVMGIQEIDHPSEKAQHTTITFTCCREFIALFYLNYTASDNSPIQSRNHSWLAIQDHFE